MAIAEHHPIVLPRLSVCRFVWGKKISCWIIYIIAGSDKLVDFTNWLRQNNKKSFLGEFGGSESTNCFSALTDALQYMQDNNDVWYVT